MIETTRFGLGFEFPESFGQAVKTEGVQLVECRMSEHGDFLSIVVAGTTQIGVIEKRGGTAFLGRRVVRLAGEKGGDARYARLLRSIARVKLLILDDWGPEAITSNQARDMLEIVEDRYDKGSLIITSQVPINRWHDLIGVPTLADAILDRVIHNAYRIELSGESLRKRHPAS